METRQKMINFVGKCRRNHRGSMCYIFKSLKDSILYEQIRNPRYCAVYCNYVGFFMEVMGLEPMTFRV